MREKEAVNGQSNEPRYWEDGSGIKRRNFLALTGGAAAALASGVTGTAAAAQDTRVESGYGVAGYGDVGYGSV